MHLLVDFQKEKERQSQPNYLLPTLIAGGVGLGALAALRMGSKASLKAMKENNPLKEVTKIEHQKNLDDIHKAVKKSSWGDATGYKGLTDAQRKTKIANRRALLKEAGLQPEPLVKGAKPPQPPDSQTGMYYLLKKGENTKNINGVSASLNRRTALKAQKIAKAKGVEYNHKGTFDFAFKPITAKVGTPKFERVLQASKEATKKFKEKAKTSSLYDSLNRTAIKRGILPIETSVDKLRFTGQNSKFDNVKPSDLNTIKTRKFLPYRPKDDGFLDSVSPVSKMNQPSKQGKYLEKALSASELENKLLNDKIGYNTKLLNDRFNKK